MIGMSILTAFFIALSSNLDNVGVGSSYGTRGINIPFITNLLIAFVTGTGTLLAMVLGNQVFLFLSAEWAGIFGGVILLGAGIWVMIQQVKMKSQRKTETTPPCSPADLAHKPLWRRLLLILDHPFLADQDFSGHIDLKEGAVLGLALTLNNLPNGVAAGMLKLPILSTTLLVVVLSILTIWVGIGIGMNIGTHWLGKRAGVASGLILMGIGVLEIILALPARL